MSEVTAARVHALFVGRPQDLEGGPNGRRWRSGVIKSSVSGPCLLGPENLDGDGQADRVHHGGPDKAVCVYPLANYERWALDHGCAELTAGAFGENLTVDGLDESSVHLGDRYRIGEALVEVSQPRSPCWKVAARWNRPDLTMLMQSTGMTGWYLRVLEPGSLHSGDPLELIDRSEPRWSIAAANEVMYRHREDREAAAELAACSALGRSWAEKLRARAERGLPEDDAARLLG